MEGLFGRFRDPSCRDICWLPRGFAGVPSVDNLLLMSQQRMLLITARITGHQRCPETTEYDTADRLRGC